MVEIMLDLETMGKGPRAAITQIGAVAFNTETQGIVSRFQRSVDLESSVRCGGEMDASTVLWWLKQSDEARAEYKGVACHIRNALQDFREFLQPFTPTEGEGVPMWGNGASFDNVILRSAYDRAEIPAPWHFWQDRCYRTVKAMNKDVPFERSGVHHRAVDDAESQALHLMAILKARAQ